MRFYASSGILKAGKMTGDFFELAKRNTNFRTELLAGITTFLTMAYIIFVNPDILSTATGMNKQALIAVTCIITAAATITVGIFAKAPIAMAPGMGLNAFFAYSLVLGHKISWQTALGVVFLSGLFFLVLTLLGLRRKLVQAIPEALIAAISVGIGLFITFIGLVKLGIVVDNKATLVSAGPLTSKVLIGLAGLAVMLFLEARKIKGALLIGIVSSTALALACGYADKPQTFKAANIRRRFSSRYHRGSQVESAGTDIQPDVHGHVRQHRDPHRVLPPRRYGRREEEYNGPRQTPGY